MAPTRCGKIRHRAPRVFYYDGDCGFCTSAVSILSRLDLLRRIAWTPYQSLTRPPKGLSLHDLKGSAYLETGRGGYHEGFYAFRGLAMHLLPLWLLTPVMWLPGVAELGTSIYRWLARNRYRISRCGLPRRRSDHPRAGPGL